MSANNDNAMTRFLFAILRQKNLKDIDWTKVAHDPILSQPITNGHAARMRYSRFRSAMLGLEPTRRNKTAAPKSRVTKSTKKDAKPAARGEDGVKSEETADSPRPSTAQQEASAAEAAAPPARIKQETPAHYGFDSRLTPGLTPGPPTFAAPVGAARTPMPTTPTIQPRLLTPCSDAEGYIPGSAIGGMPPSSPAVSDMLVGSQQAASSTSSFVDFHHGGAGCSPDQHQHQHQHQQTMDPAWAHAGGGYSAFAAAAYPYDDYAAAAAAAYEHQQQQHHHLHHHHHNHQHHLQGHLPGQLPLPDQQMLDHQHEHDQDGVKHEEWDQPH
ncbi:hypothetical protein GGR56DRAFT_13378 [Xylariaceae sp. FL0804]|nr:hypothetical protein GGR56DRAFT_13378 [Xylariaceae sp. FL0804]